LLLVKTKLAMSCIDGIGLFADQFIARGTIVWRSHPEIDIRLTPEQIHELAEPSREQICKYTYREKKSGLYVLCGDDARFFNHSPNPNCIDTCNGPDDITIASQDIVAGEELTCDYSLFDLDLAEGRYRI